MRKHSIAPVAAAVMLALAGSAQAATKTATFNVSASVAANCLISTTNLAFGAYTGVAQLNGTSTVGVRCTNTTAYSVKLNTGGGTYATRLMSDGASHSLQYNLYTDAANTVVWGDGTGSTGVNAGTGSGMSNAGIQNFTVYGTVPDNTANQSAPVGSYSDTITVSVDY